MTTHGLFQTTGAKSEGDRPTEFRAVEGGTQVASGEVLLVEAYSAIWLILMGFLLVGWRRQKQVEQRIADLERALAERAKGGATG